MCDQCGVRAGQACVDGRRRVALDRAVSRGRSPSRYVPLPTDQSRRHCDCRPLGSSPLTSGLGVAEIDCRRTDRTHPLFLSDVPPEEQGAHPPSNAHVMAMHDVLMTWVFAPAATSAAPSPSPAQSAPSAEALRSGEEAESTGVTQAAATASAPADAASPVAARNYVQGMSDLFSPLYVVLDGEQWLCYALFEYQMERHADNFLVDQSGMARQLAELQSLLRVMDRGLYHHFGACSRSSLGARLTLKLTRSETCRDDRLAQPLLLLPLAPDLVQARILVRRHDQAVGGLLHRSPRNALPSLLCARHPRGEPGRHRPVPPRV